MRDEGYCSVDEVLKRLPAADETALFLDFDGTLVDLAETPDSVVVRASLPPLLERLGARLGGALAIVTGRAGEAIEHFLPLYRGDMAASHGIERRVDGVSRPHRLAGSEAVARLHEAVEGLAARREAYLAELKPTGAVLHYRKDPALEEEAERLMRELLSGLDDFALQPAKMAFEIKPRDASKSDAVAWLMSRPAYRDRVAVYFGDDATDEPAMEWAQANGGAACKIGDGPSVALLRLRSVEEVHDLLERWGEGERA